MSVTNPTLSFLAAGVLSDLVPLEPLELELLSLPQAVTTEQEPTNSSRARR
jgi:hypothetical protein